MDGKGTPAPILGGVICSYEVAWEDGGAMNIEARIEKLERVLAPSQDYPWWHRVIGTKAECETQPRALIDAGTPRSYSLISRSCLRPNDAWPATAKIGILGDCIMFAV